MFKATHVPVGRDQIQHIEMARDIAQRFNHHFGEHLVLPNFVVDDKAAVLAGLDGRKMSKSYGNTIPLFETPKKLRKSIMKIKTNSQEPALAGVMPSNASSRCLMRYWLSLVSGITN